MPVVAALPDHIRSWASSITMVRSDIEGACMNRMAKVLGAAVASAVTLLGMALPAVAQSRVTWIGAVGVDSLQGWKQMNKDVGPSQTAREYYAGGLPSSWSDKTNFCKSLPSVICVISYHTEEKSQQAMNAFVKGISKDRAAPVFIVYWDEPEAHITSGKFINGYEKQVDEVRAACWKAHNCGVVKVGMIASTYQYQTPKMKGYGCSYIPPARYVDVYFADTYEPVLVGLGSDAGFQRWATCAKREGGSVVLGLTEYGLGVCVTKGKFTEQKRQTQLAADARYLSVHFPRLYMWEYYWHMGASAGGCKEFQFPAGSVPPKELVTAKEWQAIEHGTVRS
jgi:hypothetical protein